MTRDQLPTLDSADDSVPDSQPETQAAPAAWSVHVSNVSVGLLQPSTIELTQVLEKVDLGDGKPPVNPNQFIASDAPPDTIRMMDVTPDFDFRSATPTCCTQHAAYGMDRNPCGMPFPNGDRLTALYHTTKHRPDRTPDTRQILASILERRPLPSITPIPSRFFLQGIEEIKPGARYARDTSEGYLRRVDSLDEAVLLLPPTAKIPTHAAGFELKNSVGITFAEWIKRVGGAQKMAGLDAERAWHDGEEPEDYL